MITAEAREKLTHHGLSPEQAAGVVDVLEVWGQERAVTKDYLDARLAELKADLRKGIGDLRAEFGILRSDVEAKLRGHLIWIISVIVLGVIVQHWWR